MSAILTMSLAFGTGALSVSANGPFEHAPAWCTATQQSERPSARRYEMGFTPIACAAESLVGNTVRVLELQWQGVWGVPHRMVLRSDPRDGSATTSVDLWEGDLRHEVPVEVTGRVLASGEWCAAACWYELENTRLVLWRRSAGAAHAVEFSSIALAIAPPPVGEQGSERSEPTRRPLKPTPRMTIARRGSDWLLIGSASPTGDEAYWGHEALTWAARIPESFDALPKSADGDRVLSAEVLGNGICARASCAGSEVIVSMLDGPPLDARAAKQSPTPRRQRFVRSTPDGGWSPDAALSEGAVCTEDYDILHDGQGVWVCFREAAPTRGPRVRIRRYVEQARLWTDVENADIPGELASSNAYLHLMRDQASKAPKILVHRKDLDCGFDVHSF